MEPVEAPERAVCIRVENVGGIDETEVELVQGVTVLAGRNATNRTSLLQAMMAALGSDRASLKADADSGRVELEVGERTYTRTLERRNGEVHTGGTPYTQDPETADLFAFLLESNEARLAVSRGDNLRDIIMRPVDTEAIRADIERLEERRRELERALDDRERLAEKAAELESRRDELEDQLAAKRSELEDTRSELATTDTAVEDSLERKEELESRLADLQERRSALETTGHRLETEQETVERLREELAEVEGELDEQEAASGEQVERLADEIGELRGQKRRLDSAVNQLQSLVQFNEEMLGEDGIGALDALGSDRDDDHVTSRLLDDTSLVCWTCGQEATRSDVEQTLEALRARRQEVVDERSSVRSELEAARDRKETLVEQDRRRSRLEGRRDDLRAELSDSEAAVEELEARREELRIEVEGLEEEIEQLRVEEYDDIVELHREANELELEAQQLADDVHAVEEELAANERRRAELADRESELSDVEAALSDARTRVQRLEEEAIEAFNEHMDEILEVLDYSNIERIWVERTEREVPAGRGTSSGGSFELHVVRNTEDGAFYEDTVSHLSESEREVTGLVFALAGYLAHDVHETMPFMLLDSVEAIDADRIAGLVDYLSDFPDYLVVALLPEDAAAVDGQYPRVTTI